MKKLSSIFTVPHEACCMIPFLFLFFLFSCGKPGKVSISVDENNFPVITLRHPSGHSITIASPSASAGSIGVATDTVVHWIQGEPVTTGIAGQYNVYRWPYKEDDTLKMEIGFADDRYNLSIGLVKQKTCAYHLNIGATESEYFTGAFERVVDGPQNRSWAKDISTALNLRGERVEIRLKPTVSAYAPFYLSSAGYGLFVKGTWPGVFDFCRDYPGTVQVSFQGPEVDMVLYIADNPMEIVRAHALETGPSFVPPDWAFGPWRWRDEHRNYRVHFDSSVVKAPFNSDLVEDILLMKFYDIPSTAYWIDRPWAAGVNGYDDFEWDTLRFPRPEKMIQWVNSKKMEMMLWIGPFVMGKMADYAEEMGYDLIGRVRGNLRQVLIDFSNPEAVKWWGENGPAKLARMGIRGFKLDRADGEKEVDSLHLVTHAGLSYRENYNDYPRQYVKATYDAVKPVLGDNFILFPRAQYTGSSRYGGMWAGDIIAPPEGLRAALIAMQRCAVMGYPVWGSDIGGYHGGFFRETAMRWLGFGCFSPIMEVGPTRNRGFWNLADEPKHDTTLIATWRLYAKTRMKLIPYIKSLAVEANTTGTPICRPLFLEYPEQPEAWINWQSFLMGRDILVSVIWEEGKTEQEVWLPAGETWIDAWEQGKMYRGGRYLKVFAEPYKTPVFIRKGSDIDLGDLNALFRESLILAKKKPDLAAMEAEEGWK